MEFDILGTLQALKKKRIAPVFDMGLPMASTKELKMAALRQSTKANLDKQGFEGLDDDAKSCYAGPLRFTPAVGTILIVLGLAMQSPIFLGLGAIVPLTGALFPRGMILDLVYNLGVRHMFRAPALPPTPNPRRFSYLLSTVLIAGAAISIYYGLSVLGIVLGGMVALGGTILTTTHWCLGSWFYRLFFPHAAAR